MVQISKLLIVAWLASCLVVQPGEECAVFRVLFEILVVFEIASWAYMVLHKWEVNRLISEAIYEVAHNSTWAVRQSSNTLLGSSNRHIVAHFSLHFALLNDISSNESTLWETHYAEFLDILKVSILLEWGACWLSLLLKALKPTRKWAVAYFNAFSCDAKCLSYLRGKWAHSWERTL